MLSSNESRMVSLLVRTCAISRPSVVGLIWKKMIALASVERDQSTVGGTLNMEMTVESVRHTVSATIVPMPFFNPPRKTAVPVV